MKQCEKCGQTVADGAAFCANCGAVVNNTIAPEGVAGVNPSIGQSSIVENNVDKQPIMTDSATIGQPTVSSSDLMMGQTVDQQTNAVASSSTATEGGTKKKMDGKMIAMIAVSAVCLIIGIVGIVLAVVNSGNRGIASDESGGGQIAGNTPSTGGGTIDVVSSGTKVSYSGYEFLIPENYEYEVTEVDGVEALVYSDNNDFAAATTYFDDVTYASVKSNIDIVAEAFEKETGMSIDTSVETVDGVEFLCFDFGYSGGYSQMLVISAADLYYFETSIVGNGDSDNTDYLSSVAKVVGSAKKKTGNRLIGEDRFNGIGFPEVTFSTGE